MAIKDQMLLLDEGGNAMDNLIQSLTFLSQVEQNFYNLKWFVIAFHGALYTFMLLVLQKTDVTLMYKRQPTYKTQGDNFDPFDGHLKNFLGAYIHIKDKSLLGDKAFEATQLIDDAMKELNDKLRNQFMHFIPMSFGAGPGYVAEVCHPLLNVLRFCVSYNGTANYLSQEHKETAYSYIDSMSSLLNQQKKLDW